MAYTWLIKLLSSTVCLYPLCWHNHSTLLRYHLFWAHNHKTCLFLTYFCKLSIKTYNQSIFFFLHWAEETLQLLPAAACRYWMWKCLFPVEIKVWKSKKKRKISPSENSWTEPEKFTKYGRQLEEHTQVVAERTHDKGRSGM